jgi:hypothetical protein
MRVRTVTTGCHLRVRTQQPLPLHPPMSTHTRTHTHTHTHTHTQLHIHIHTHTHTHHVIKGVEPGDIIVERSVRENADRYLFFGAVAHIRKVKSGPFHEHSRYLYDMSAVGDWKRVNSGLLKMFDAEVLFKVRLILSILAIL